MVEGVASKIVLDPHPAAAGAGIIGVGVGATTLIRRKYWELKGLHELTFLYEERKDHLPSFIRLHNIMQRQGIDDENDIANVLKYAKELPNLQQYWENIQANNHNLKCENQNLEKELQARRRQIAVLQTDLIENIDRTKKGH